EPAGVPVALELALVMVAPVARHVVHLEGDPPRSVLPELQLAVVEPGQPAVLHLGLCRQAGIAERHHVPGVDVPACLWAEVLVAAPAGGEHQRRGRGELHQAARQVSPLHLLLHRWAPGGAVGVSHTRWDTQTSRGAYQGGGPDALVAAGEAPDDPMLGITRRLWREGTAR